MRYKYYHIRKETYNLDEDLNFWNKNGFEIVSILEPETNCFDVILRKEGENGNQGK